MSVTEVLLPNVCVFLVCSQARGLLGTTEPRHRGLPDRPWRALWHATGRVVTCVRLDFGRGSTWTEVPAVSSPRPRPGALPVCPGTRGLAPEPALLPRGALCVRVTHTRLQDSHRRDKLRFPSAQPFEVADGFVMVGNLISAPPAWCFLRSPGCRVGGVIAVLPLTARWTGLGAGSALSTQLRGEGTSWWGPRSSQGAQGPGGWTEGLSVPSTVGGTRQSPWPRPRGVASAGPCPQAPRDT